MDPSAGKNAVIQNPGILLVGHGTRNREGTREFLELADMVAARAGTIPVEPCFLELCQPDMQSGWRRLVERGATRIRMVPVLLWAAGHALRDLPAAAEQLTVAHPGTTFEQSEVLGFHPEILRRSQELHTTALQRWEDYRPERAALVLVGRGSTEDGATADMIRFGECRARMQEEGRVEVGFFAMAQPSLGEILDEVGRDPGIRDVMVQPHLLFAGELHCAICKMTRRAAMRYPGKRWGVTGLLGPNDLVAKALLDRCGVARHPAVSSRAPAPSPQA